MPDDPEVIFSYTRAQAIDEGVLVDVSSVAREAGFVIPVALTRTVWQSHVRVPAGVEAQDEVGRLWDVLWMLRCAIRQGGTGGDTIRFRLHVRNETCVPGLVTLNASCGPDDEGKPCVTVMLPEED